MTFIDLIFVGGGINGLCTAYQLARRGTRTILIEKVHFIAILIFVILYFFNLFYAIKRQFTIKVGYLKSIIFQNRIVT